MALAEFPETLGITPTMEVTLPQSLFQPHCLTQDTELYAPPPTSRGLLPTAAFYTVAAL